MKCAPRFFARHVIWKFSTPFDIAEKVLYHLIWIIIPFSPYICWQQYTTDTLTSTDVSLCLWIRQITFSSFTYKCEFTGRKERKIYSLRTLYGVFCGRIFLGKHILFWAQKIRCRSLAKFVKTIKKLSVSTEYDLYAPCRYCQSDRDQYLTRALRKGSLLPFLCKYPCKLCLKKMNNL